MNTETAPPVYYWRLLLIAASPARRAWADLMAAPEFLRNREGGVCFTGAAIRFNGRNQEVLVLPQFVDDLIVNAQHAVIAVESDFYIFNYNHFAGTVYNGQFISELIEPETVVCEKHTARESGKIMPETVKNINGVYYGKRTRSVFQYHFETDFIGYAIAVGVASEVFFSAYDPPAQNFGYALSRKFSPAACFALDIAWQTMLQCSSFDTDIPNIFDADIVAFACREFCLVSERLSFVLICKDITTFRTVGCAARHAYRG